MQPEAKLKHDRGLFYGRRRRGVEKHIFIGKLLKSSNQNKPTSKDYISKKFYGLM